jgi:hypothetical protein
MLPGAAGFARGRGGNRSGVDALFWVFVAAAVAGAAATLVKTVAAYPTLSRAERVALLWWVAIGAVAGAAFLLLATTERPWLLPVAGLLMVGLGLFLATNRLGVADDLARRRMGIGPIWQQSSSGTWRLNGAVLCVLGVGWTVFGALVP